ncbi:MAG TPA: glycosyl hydrolase family 43 [Spirochaetaceae bacterium]|nr:glycosyl hydrolase family 43 [Spirochaetaceae bacterium]
MKIDEFLALSWTAPGEPLIEAPRYSPIIADPSFLFPEESAEGQWTLAAHSAWGVHVYRSNDGLSWRDRGLAARHAMRPFLRKLGQDYYLYYERYRPFALPMTALPWRPRWRSALALSTSPDLKRWQDLGTLMEPDQPWMRAEGLGAALSNPCLARYGDAWRLYYSASLSYIDDCGFCEPRSIGYADALEPGGPFKPANVPCIDPDAQPELAPLGAGSIKVLKLDDGWLGLQNTIYKDASGRSRSAIFILRSADGVSWRRARKEALLAPTTGWMSSHVYACDCRFREADGLWYLYFNARDGWKITEGRERIGRITGRH